MKIIHTEKCYGSYTADRYVNRKIYKTIALLNKLVKIINLVVYNTKAYLKSIKSFIGKPK